MAATNYNLSDMAWLGQPADPQNLVRGAMAGVAIANTRAQRERINLERAQLNAELAQMPLKQTLAQQQVELNQYRLTDALEQRQNYVGVTKAWTEVNKDVMTNLASGNLKEAVTRHVMAGVTDNRLLEDPRYKALGARLDALQKEADVSAYRLSVAQAAEDRAAAYAATAGLREQANNLREQELKLKTERETRLQTEFDLRVRKFESQVPQSRLAEFRERARAIQNDLTLLGKPDEADAKLKALADELLKAPLAAPATAPASTNAPGQFKQVGGFKVRVK